MTRFRPCTYCDGRGCEECDDTGQSWTHVKDGMRMHGSGPDGPSPEFVEALRVLSIAALTPMPEERS